MTLHRTIAVVTTLLAGWCPAQVLLPAATASWQQIRQKRLELAKAGFEAGRLVSVNGKVLSAEAVKRDLIFLVAPKQVDAKVIDFIVRQHIEQAIADGRDPEEFEITEEQVEEALSRAGRVPEQRGLDTAALQMQLRRTELFDRVFFPGSAANWPTITRESMVASGDSKQFWARLEKASVDANGKPCKLPPFWMQLCRRWVTNQLRRDSEIRFPADGLPVDVCLQVDGVAWPTGQAFSRVRVGIESQDFERAMTEVTVREILRQELQSKGAYLSDEEYGREYHAYRELHDSTPFTSEVLAMAKGYPSLEAFRQRWRLMLSFEAMITAEIDDQVLQAYVEDNARSLGDGQTDVDVIQFLVRDVHTGSWLPNGDAQARARATAALAAIEQGAGFDAVMAERGEYLSVDEERGHLENMSLDKLRRSLGESEYQDLLMGYSVGSVLFDEAEIGKVCGPLRGPEGWYLARVNSRTPACTEVSIDERKRASLQQGYMYHRFLLWANEVIARATIK